MSGAKYVKKKKSGGFKWWYILIPGAIIGILGAISGNDNKSKDQAVIYPCTNSGYGSKNDGVCTEESPLNPITLYGITKVDAEKAYRKVDNYITFRLATVFGPSSRMRTDLLVNSFVLKALRERLLVLYECEFMRNYVHIQKF